MNFKIDKRTIEQQVNSKFNEFLVEKKQFDSELNEFLIEKQKLESKLNEFMIKKEKFDIKLNEFLIEKKQLKSTIDVSNSKEFDKPNKYILYFDGASKGNPGLSGAGAVLYIDGSEEKEIGETSYFVGEHETNNVAEYHGLIIGFELAKRENVRKLVVRGDSKLVICQMKGEWKVKAKNLLPFYKKCKKFEKEFDEVIYEHVYRTNNSRADTLANIGIEKEDV